MPRRPIDSLLLMILIEALLTLAGDAPVRDLRVLCLHATAAAIEALSSAASAALAALRAAAGSRWASEETRIIAALRDASVAAKRVLSSLTGDAAVSTALLAGVAAILHRVEQQRVSWEEFVEMSRDGRALLFACAHDADDATVDCAAAASGDDTESGSNSCGYDFVGSDFEEPCGSDQEG